MKLFTIVFDHDVRDPNCIAFFKWDGNIIHVFHDIGKPHTWQVRIFNSIKQSLMGPFPRYIDALNAAYIILDLLPIRPKDLYEWDILIDFIKKYNK